jgi:hypothetical protein
MLRLRARLREGMGRGSRGRRRGWRSMSWRVGRIMGRRIQSRVSADEETCKEDCAIRGMV